MQIVDSFYNDRTTIELILRITPCTEYTKHFMTYNWYTLSIFRKIIHSIVIKDGHLTKSQLMNYRLFFNVKVIDENNPQMHTKNH